MHDDDCSEAADATDDDGFCVRFRGRALLKFALSVNARNAKLARLTGRRLERALNVVCWCRLLLLTRMLSEALPLQFICIAR